jgi:hypothetical protein
MCWTHMQSLASGAILEGEEMLGGKDQLEEVGLWMVCLW